MRTRLNQLAPHFRGTLSGLRPAAAAGPEQPDDLELPALARAALNYLRGNPDPARNYECKFSLGPLGIPCHVPLLPPNRFAYDPISLGDTDNRMDWQYPHMREMAGEHAADPVELGVRRRVLSYQRADHLCWVNPAACVGPEHPIEDEWVLSWTTAKLLYSLAEAFARTGEPSLRAETKAMVRALKGMALWDGPRAYYLGIAPCRGGEWLQVGWAAEHARNYPFIVEPLVRYWACTGDEEGLDLARAFAEGFLAHSQPNQGEDGDYRIHPATGAFQHHVHCHTHATWGVAHLGVILGEQRYLDWVRRAFDFVTRLGTDYGWYPEFIPQQEYRTEICVVGDMISNAAWLARGGRPEYWDHVERAVRNELRRSQFVLTPAFVELFHRVHSAQPVAVVEPALAELRRIEGGFVAQATFNDWVSYPDTPGRPGMYANGVHMMGCCPPEGMRGLWEAWLGTVEERADGVTVNLAFTRDHAAAGVTAHRPADGRLDVAAKKPGAYHLRPPAWADPAAVRLARNGHNAPVERGGPAGAYVVCRDVARGDRLTLRWAVPAFQQSFTPQSIAGRTAPVTVDWVGNEVADVEPRGQFLPMFGLSS